ncbi:GAF domain-containing protein [Massilia sp. MS-15]|uniref:hybrid sensor histidine kinase/response regulator n=1 Tax=Massilia sp. MS-15 TaxID=2878200 RepID=UPI001CD382C2|nr:GAF domain-containing protein [Massilia sp. MS-15]MCA1248601.1 GAF domain-containing protein [Massilia sp. MS-15]
MSNHSSLPLLPLPGSGLPWPFKPDTWAEGMQAIADLIVGAHFPMAIAWGPELRLFYNEAYADLLGDKHPAALGEPYPQVRPELWPRLQPHVAQVLAGHTVHLEDVLTDLRRNGKHERRYFSVSITPVRHGGAIVGVYFVLSDTTSRVLAEHRHAFHLKLSDTLRGLVDAVRTMEAASRLTGEYLGVGRVGYGEIDAAGRSVSMHRDWTDGSIASLAGESRALDSFGPAIIAQLRLGRTVRLDDIGADTRAAPYAAGYASIGARAMLIVPLLEEGRLAAIFYLHEQQPRHWGDHEVALAEDVARHTCEAVRRARVEESLRDEKRVLEMVNRSGQALASTLDLDTLLQAITDAATELAGARVGAFFYRVQDGQGARPQAYTLSGTAPAELARFASLLGPGLGSEAPVRCEDITCDPRHAAQAGAAGVRSYLALPVVSRSGAVLGGLCFGHCEPGVFTERTERILAGVAAQAAVAIDNARLYEVAQKSALERDALLQSERAARVQAERLSHTKDDFLAMLAHELRNPLAPISSSASLLSMQFRDEPRIRQASTIISRQVRHMSRLIDDLLDVSRVTRGLVKLKLGVVDFRDVVVGALDQARPLLDEKEQQVALALPPVPVCVRGDHTRLVQSVANILNNAAKYTQKGGRIALELGMDAGSMRLTVSDNGSGMPPELLPNVFDLFTQGARTLARSQGGLGLGLTLVKRLVELHGGEVGAHSEGVGLGSRFTLALPCVETAPGSAEADDAAPGTAGVPETALARPLRLVLVDDNADAADSLCTLLDVQGYHSAVEYDARSALRRARAERPDAMLVDIGLPDIDGYHLAEQLRAMPETSHTVLVAITGYGQASDRERALAAGFAHHLVKPVDMTALVRVLEAVGAAAARAQAAASPA